MSLVLLLSDLGVTFGATIVQSSFNGEVDAVVDRLNCNRSTLFGLENDLNCVANSSNTHSPARLHEVGDAGIGNYDMESISVLKRLSTIERTVCCDLNNGSVSGGM